MTQTHEMKRKWRPALLAALLTGTLALGAVGTEAPTALAGTTSDALWAPTAPLDATTLVFDADPAYAGQPAIILAVDAAGNVAPIADTVVAPGTNVLPVPTTGASSYAVVTPTQGPVWAGRPWTDNGELAY